MVVRRARPVFERWGMASSPYDRRERTRARTTFTRILGVFAHAWADSTLITLRAREAFRALCATCWFVRPQRVKCTPRYLTSFDAKMLCPFTLMCTSVFWEVLVWNGTNTVFWEERANPFTCIKWTTPSTASWNSFMLCFTHELFVWRRLMWVSVHIARSSAYMVSTTFPFTAVSTSWTMMLNNREGDHRSLRNAHTYSFSGRLWLPSTWPASICRSGRIWCSCTCCQKFRSCWVSVAAWHARPGRRQGRCQRSTSVGPFSSLLPSRRSHPVSPGGLWHPVPVGNRPGTRGTLSWTHSSILVCSWSPVRTLSLGGMSGRWVCNCRAPSSVCRVCGSGRQWRVSIRRELCPHPSIFGRNPAGSSETTRGPLSASDTRRCPHRWRLWLSWWKPRLVLARCRSVGC